MRRSFTLPSLTLGGTRRLGGWLVVPHVTFDAHELTVGVTWQREAFEDPDPLVSLHLPGVYLWLRFYRVLPGYRAKRRQRRSTLNEREAGRG